jgi:threonine dehydratase
MVQPDMKAIEAAAETVYANMPPTPQYCWPLLCERLGAEVWVKHENHTPVGAFKIRGGLVYFAHQVRTGTLRNGVISATRGNHGQSLGYAARRYGVPAAVVVPMGTAWEKTPPCGHWAST